MCAFFYLGKLYIKTKERTLSIHHLQLSTLFLLLLMNLGFIYFSFSFVVIYRQAKDVIKAIKKRLGSKSKDTQLFTVMVSLTLTHVFTFYTI